MELELSSGTASRAGSCIADILKGGFLWIHRLLDSPPEMVKNLEVLLELGSTLGGNVCTWIAFVVPGGSGSVSF